MSFIDAIDVGLTITAGSNAPVTIPGAQVKHVSLDIHGYGFSGQVVFDAPTLYRADDTFFQAFKALDLIEVALTLEAAYNMPDPAPEAIAVRGLCTAKSVIEKGYGKAPDGAAYHRRYRVEFADIARVLWPQHFPCVLLTDASLSDLIDQQKPAGMSLSYDWFSLGQKCDMLCLPLDGDTSEASFYDFVMWLVDTRNGVFTYDGTSHRYQLRDKKARTGTASVASALEFSSARVFVPETIRHDAAVLDAVAEGSANTAITQSQSVTGVRQDMLVIEHLPSAYDSRVALEKTRLETRAPVLEIAFNTYPSVAVAPGKCVTFDADTTHLFSSYLSSSDKYWVYSLSVRLDAVAGESYGQDLDQAHTAYRAEIVAHLEETSESYVELPAYQVPRWPIEVEGKVVSVSGASTDKTYYVYDDQNTSLTMYNVYIPVWNKEISVPYVPQGNPGHYHFPAFRDQRVLMDLFFERAEIQRFLDFGARVQLPMDTQGNHILFGQNEASETSMRYAYEDGKSLFEVMRVMAGEHVSWQMKEGLLYLEVREDEDASATETTYDVKAEVAAAQNELESSISGGISDVTGSFQTGSADLGGAIGDATSEVEGSLATMESELSSSISDTQSQVESAKSGLAGSAAQVSSSASAASSELLAKAKG